MKEEDPEEKEGVFTHEEWIAGRGRRERPVCDIGEAIKRALVEEEMGFIDCL